MKVFGGMWEGQGCGEDGKRKCGRMWGRETYLKKLGSRLGNCIEFLISTVNLSAMIFGPR